MSKEYLIVALGNPGKDYELTRHNLGFLVIEQFIKTHSIKLENSSFTRGLTAKAKIKNKSVHILLPMTYMNNSGAAVKQFLAHVPIDGDDMLIVTDDFNLDFGQLRIRKNGSDGGHNGLRSIIEHLNTQNFGRLRLGIGQPKGKKDTVDYVLEEFTKSEKKELDIFINEASDCCLAWLNDGIEKTMNQYNRRREG